VGSIASLSGQDAFLFLRVTWMYGEGSGKTEF